VIAIAVLTGTVGLVAGRTDVGRRLFDEARGAVGLAARTTTTAVPGAPGEADGSAATDSGDRAVTADGGLARTAPVAAFVDFDPGGDDSGEHPELLRLVNDADPEDGWHTERYSSRDFGSLKQGVGLIVRLEHPSAVDQVVVSSPDDGWSVAVYGSTTGIPGDIAGWGAPLGGASDVRGDALVPVEGAEVSTLLVWITDLGPAHDGGHSVTITRVDPLLVDDGTTGDTEAQPAAGSVAQSPGTVLTPS
jgi:hypothetical protein